MSARPWKVTPEVLAALEREAALRSQITTYKNLGRRLGLSPSYVAKVIWHLSHGRREKFAALETGPLEPDPL